jgi:predicted amidophosphoribosyltransferase
VLLRELRGVPTAIAYEGTGARLVQRFKFEGRRDALEVLLAGLLERARELTGELRIDGIVPVPRHPRRVRELGADPVHQLGLALAAGLGLPLLARALRRTRWTPPQTDLSPAERCSNVAGSFVARPGSLIGRRALLLDDVTTTGATLAAARRELRHRACARTVAALALAGTPVLPSRPLSTL